MRIGIISLTLMLLVSACSAQSAPANDAGEPQSSQNDSQSQSESQSELEEQAVEGASTPDQSTAATVDFSEYNIITLLPRDAIPAIDNPDYYDVAAANNEYADEEQVIGVVFNGEARAYSTGLLSSHEIVNDTVGGRHISVTW